MRDDPEEQELLTPAFPPVKDRIKVLDGVRAQAIFMVILFHLTGFFPGIYVSAFKILGSPYINRIFLNAWLGVDLFFVLSGFLITGQLLANPLESREKLWSATKTFLKKRFLRIAPAYYTVLVCVFGGLVPVPLLSQAGAPALHTLIVHLFFLQDIFHPFTRTLNVFWSLATEAKFYVLAPFIVLGFSRLPPKTRYGALAAVMLMLPLIKIIALPWMGPVTPDNFFLKIRVPFYRNLDGLFAGMICRFLWHDDRIRHFLSRADRANILFWGGLFFLVVLLAVMTPCFTPDGSGVTFFSETLLLTTVSLLFSAIILGLLGGCHGHRFFEAGLLKVFALISYSLYLIHFFFCKKIALLATAWFAGAPPTLIWLAAVGLLMAAITPLSLALYYLIERPFIRRAHRSKQQVDA